VIADPGHAANVARMKQRLVEMQHAMGDPLTAAE
jgi:hypothetical protein